MKIHLQNIERDIQETNFLKAEEIMQLDHVQSLVELEKNIWTALVQDIGIWEVEAEFTGNILKKSTCECASFDKKTLCPHVVALLLKVRPLKIKPPKPKPSPVETKKYVEKFSITSLVESIEEEDLKKFVKTYARQHKDFSIAIKARFAGGMSEIQGPGKYKLILEESRKSNRRIGKAFNLSGQRNYIRVIKELIAQAESALNEMNFPNCGELLMSILQELPLNLSFVVKSKQPMLQPMHQAYDLFSQLLDYPLAPELLQETHDFLLAQLDLEGTAAKYSRIRVLNIIKSIDRSESFNIKLLDKINELLLAVDLGTAAYEQLETVRIDLMLSLNQDPFASTALSPEHPIILLKLLEHQLENKNYEALLQTITFAQGLELEQETKFEVDEYWLKYAKAKSDKKLTIKVAELCLLQSFNSTYLDDIKELKSKEWSKYLVGLMEQILKQPYSIPQRDLVALIFRREEKPEALIAYIEQLDSLDLMYKYGSWLQAFLHDEVCLAYPTLVKHYAAQHIGPKANEKIKNNLLEIKKLFGPAEMKALKDYLRKEYPHTSLLKKLETRSI